jgi:ABC-type sugar transport system substrate-binding protein
MDFGTRNWGTMRRGALLAAGLLSLGAFGLSSAVAADRDPRLQWPDTYQGPTDPAPAPKGIKLAVVSCTAALHGCQVQADSAFDAGKRLGWDVQMYDGKGQPNTQAAALLDALAWGADAIIAVSIDHRTIQLPLQEAKKRGVPVVAIGQSGDTPNRLPELEAGQLAWSSAIDVDANGLGRAVAQWIVNASNGKGNVVVYNDVEFAGVVEQVAGLMQGLKDCSDCKVTEEQMVAAQVATNLGQQVTGYLRAHPEVEYVFAPYDPAGFAMAAAIRQAGMGDRVKVVSVVGNEENLNLIRTGGVQVADGAFDTEYTGYAAVDHVIRHLNKQPIMDPHNENVPYIVLDKTNVPASGNWRSNIDTVGKFMSLWKN